MKEYEIVTTEFGEVINAKNDLGQVAVIPKDLANPDYQDYLASVAENNKATEIEAE
jgi:acyl-CoA hydrolase